MRILFDWNGTSVNGAPVDPNDRIMFYVEFVGSDGSSVWYPPLSQDGIADTDATRESVDVTPAQAGIRPGSWTAYVHTVQIEQNGNTLRSERSAAAPFVLAKPNPSAPENLLVVV